MSIAVEDRQTTAPASQTLVQANPEEIGFCPQRLGRIKTALDREVAEGRLPGAVIAVCRAGKLAYQATVGTRDPASGAPMQSDAIFSIASMTKAMVSTAIMMLWEEGRILLSDPASKYLPELADMTVATGDGSLRALPVENPFTIQDLLRHTSGLTYANRGTSEVHKRYPGSSATAAVSHSRDEFLAALADAPLLYPPGTAWEYGFSTDVLGLIVEAISGQTLGEFLTKRIWGPLGMPDTGFVLKDEDKERYARAFETCPVTGEKFTVHHATGESFQYESGGGGCVSTAADYARFVQMLERGGDLNGTRLLGRKTVAYMRADHLGSEIENRITTMDPACVGYGFGLGFAVRQQPGVSGVIGSTGDYYWSGVYGTYFWVDPAEELTTVFMSAAPGPIRLRYRQLTRALVLQALVD